MKSWKESSTIPSVTYVSLPSPEPVGEKKKKTKEPEKIVSECVCVRCMCVCVRVCVFSIIICIHKEGAKRLFIHLMPFKILYLVCTI